MNGQKIEGGKYELSTALETMEAWHHTTALVHPTPARPIPKQQSWQLKRDNRDRGPRHQRTTKTDLDDLAEGRPTKRRKS